jgi:2-C-methyl-D-erythritol 4-phosphate cytidylyltransferase
LQNQYLILVAGGTGSRMNSTVPKQFMDLKGQPVIIRTLRCFLNYNAGMRVIISVHPDYKEQMQELIRTAGLEQAKIQITIGGNTRFASVRNGLALVEDLAAIVGIHDAARPFVSLATIQRCFEGAARHGNAIPCVSISESLRRVEGENSAAVSRDDYRIVQTPQCFLAADIKKAFEQAYRPAFTDDATVLEAIGLRICLVEGNAENIKITTPHDLLLANNLIKP